MATSGSVNYNQTVIEVIEDAFQVIGVYGIGRTISAADYSFAFRTLNKLVKSWGTKGLHLWTKEENTLFVSKDTSLYTLGNGAKAAKASDVVITQLNGSAAASATSLTVDSTTGMAVSDVIGVVLTSGAVHYTTIATIPTSTTLTISSGLASAASDDANVYTYTTAITKPLRILSCRRVEGIDSGATTTMYEVEMTSLAYDTYMNLPTKSISGVPNQFTYNPNLTDGSLYIWPRPNSGIYRINFTSERVIEDLDALTNDFDFPAEWLEALTWQLALRLCPAFGKDQRMVNSILPMAQAMLQDLLDWDSEISSLEFQPDLEG
jgi:hypothetical protein